MMRKVAWILLASLFCKTRQDGNDQQNASSAVLHCEPQGLTLTSSDQTMFLTWEDEPSCPAAQDKLIYELVVLVADKQDQVAVTPEQIGLTHFWNWTSHLAFECATHSVRLNSLYKNQKGPWKLERTLLRKANLPGVYPKDKVFSVGSTATFCCVLLEGKSFDRMFLTQYNDGDMTTTKLSSQTYSLTVNLNQPSQSSCTDIICHDKTGEQAACAYVGYPPNDKDLQCQTRDLESVECHWTVGNNTTLPQLKTSYSLLESQCKTDGRCYMKTQVYVGKKDWTLTAENVLGKVELTDRANIAERVHMYAPERLTDSTVNARNVSLKWEWKWETMQRYNNLTITCQLNVSHGGTHTISVKTGVGLHLAVLNDLLPNSKYSVAVRCGTTLHFWKWSEWSTTVSFHTKGDVPDPLDVWMQMKDNKVIIMWKKLLASQSHGNITHYNVTWAQTTETQRQTRMVDYSKHYAALSLDPTNVYTVTVTAWNINGSSPPSTIITPRFSPDGTMNSSWILGSNSSFSLSWSASPNASCGYIVDWCPTSRQSRLDWLRVPPHQTKTTIFSENFADGLRYSLSIYACTHEAPVLLGRREGYVNEERIKDGLFEPLVLTQQDSDVLVSWNPIFLANQTAFIQGYILYWSEIKHSDIFSVSTVNPEATSLTAKNLKISSYTFTVKAQTAVGECGTTVSSITLTDNLIKAVFIALLTVFCVLSLLTILCLRHWTCIKHKIYPSIPKPVLTDKWKASPGEHGCRPLFVDQSHQSEAEIMDVPELFCKSGVQVNSSMGQENVPFVYTQTLTNLSYNLILQTEEQQFNSECELQGEKERSSSGYHPQILTETPSLNQTEDRPNSRLSCISTYIMLPSK